MAQLKTTLLTVLAIGIVFAGFPIADRFLSNSSPARATISARTVDSGASHEHRTIRTRRDNFQSATLLLTVEDDRNADEFAEPIDLERPIDSGASGDSGQSLLALGRRYVDEHDLERAQAVLGRAARYPEFKGESLFHLARIEARRGHVQEAVEFLHAASEAGFHDLATVLADKDLNRLGRTRKFQKQAASHPLTSPTNVSAVHQPQPIRM